MIAGLTILVPIVLGVVFFALYASSGMIWPFGTLVVAIAVIAVGLYFTSPTATFPQSKSVRMLAGVVLVAAGILGTGGAF